MIPVLATFLGAALVLVVAASFLARAADRIAESSGLGRVWIGSVLLAGATSLPELSVDVSAVRQGAANLAAGDLFGSSMANMLILAALGLMPPRDAIFRRSSLDHALSAGLAILMNALAAALVFTGSSALLLGVSQGAAGLLLLFLVGSHVVYRQGAGAAALGAVTAVPRREREDWRRPALHFALAALVILAVAPFFARSAARLAELSGLGTTFFGTLFVGLCTSLPEIVACVAAVRMGSVDLAVGNLFGSNVFNMTIFFAMDLAVPGTSIFTLVDRGHVLSSLCSVILMALGLASIVFRAERRLALIEPGSLLMVLAYAASMVALYRANVPA